MSNRYGAVGGLFANRLEFADGRVVGPVMGGASIYALSAFLFKTDDVLLIAGCGKDVDKYYGDWFKRNSIDTSALKKKIDRNEYSFIHYNPDGTWTAGSTYGPEFRKTVLPGIRLSMEEITPYLNQLDAVYFCGFHPEEIEEIRKIKENHKLTIMWEMPSNMAKEGVETVRQYLSVSDIWSLNRPESFELFGCEDEKVVLRELIKLDIPCFYRVGEKGSYMVMNRKVYFAPSILREDGVDPTGCGNSSTAAALYAFNEGYKADEIAAFANTVASFTVRQYGPYPVFSEEVRAEAQKIFEENLTKAKEINMLREAEFNLAEQAKIASEVALSVYDYNMESYREFFGLTEEYIRDVKSIEITGCGDSWMTSNSVKALFEKLTGLPTNARRPIELSRYCDYEKLDNPLFIGVTISGGVARTRECILKGQNKGYKTFAVTNGKASPTASVVDHFAHIGMPAGLKSGYGLHSYDCSCVTLVFTACAIGVLNGHLEAQKAEEILADFREFIASYEGFVRESLPTQERLAQQWYKLPHFAFVGEGFDYSNAYFSCANIFEEIGETALGVDTLNFRDYCGSLKNPENSGTVFFVNSYNKAKDIQLENIRFAVENGQNVCVITDIDDLKVEGATVIVTPKAKISNFNGALQHLAFDGCVAYIRGLREMVSFCADDPRYGKDEVRGRLKNTAMLVD